MILQPGPQHKDGLIKKVLVYAVGDKKIFIKYEISDEKYL